MSNLEEKAFLLLTVAVTLAFAWILLPFYAAILWGTVSAIVFAPFCRGLAGPARQRPNLAALATILLIIVIVILPLTAIAASLVQEAANLYEAIKSGEVNFALYFQQISAALPLWAKSLLTRFGLGNLGAFQDKLVLGLSQSSQQLAAQILAIGQSTFEFVVSLCLMMYLLFFLLRDGDALFKRIGKVIPLHAEQQVALFTKLATVVRATVKGDFLVAMLQGALGGLVFWLLDIHAPILWGVMMAFLSLVPAIGASLIWLPVAIYLLATGAVWQGSVLIGFGALVIGLVDNFLRPALVGKDTKLPGYVVLISTFGGINMFGLNGLVIGPVIAAMFFVVWEIFAAARQRSRVVVESP